MCKHRIGYPQVALSILKINRVDLLRHGRRTDFALYQLLLEIPFTDIAPDILREIDQDGIRQL